MATRRKILGDSEACLATGHRHGHDDCQRRARSGGWYRAVGVDEWQSDRGHGTSVGVIDTGIGPHADLTHLKTSARSLTGSWIRTAASVLPQTAPGPVEYPAAFGHCVSISAVGLLSPCDGMPAIETNTRKIVARLEREGWGGGKHARFKHSANPGVVIVVPRRRQQTIGAARAIAKAADWI